MKRLLTLVILSIFISCGLYAQVVVNNNVAGKLKKQIDKKEYANIKTLTITGNLDNSDMAFIEKKLVNLEKLSLLELSDRIFSVPVLPNLKVLILPSNCESDNRTGDVYISDCIKKNTNLEFVAMHHEIAKKVGSMPNLKKVFLYSYERYDSKGVQIDTLIIPALSKYKGVDGERYSCNFSASGYTPRIIQTDNETILNAYEPDRTDFTGINILPDLPEDKQVNTPSELDLSDVHLIGKGYFRNSTVKSIKFSPELRVIGEDAFTGCDNLTELDFPKGDVSLLSNQMTKDYSHIKNIHFHKPVHFRADYECKGGDCTIEFDKASTVVLDRVETPFSHFIFDEADNKVNERLLYYVKYVEVPTEEMAQKFRAEMSSPYVYVKGKPLKSYNIKVEKPGTILSYLPTDELSYIDSLTVTGVLYETDLKVIDKCSRLVYLDLGKVVTRTSPQKAKEQQENREFYRALFGMLSSEADAMYNNNEMSAVDYTYAKVFTELGKESTKVTSSIKDCDITNAFDKKLFLKTLILPYRGYYIGYAFNDCPELENVQLPVRTKAIKESFNNCPKLKDLNFPSSMVYIDGFDGCNSLEVVDLSKMTFEEYDSQNFSIKWTNAFNHCAKLRELRLPEGIQYMKNCPRYNDADKTGTNKSFLVKVYYPKSLVEGVSLSGLNNMELHFKTMEPPSEYDMGKNYGISYPHTGDHVTIYCPKGSATAYFNATNGATNVTIKEE